MPGRSSGGDKIPAGRAQRNFPVPRGHAPHPLPPPVVTISAGKGLAATGGGDNSIHLISKGAIVASGDRPSPTEAAAETRPFGTPCTRPGLSGPLGGGAHESSCTSCNLLGQVSLPFDLLGRVSHPRNSRQDKGLHLVEGLQGDPSPCGGIQRGACPPLRIQLRESYPPPNPLPRTKSLRRGHRSGAGGGF